MFPLAERQAREEELFPITRRKAEPVAAPEKKAAGGGCARRILAMAIRFAPQAPTETATLRLMKTFQTRAAESFPRCAFLSKEPRL